MKSLIAVGLAILSSVASSLAVEFTTAEYRGNRFTICRVDVRKERLQLFHRDEAGRPFKRFTRLESWLGERGQKLVFAMNAGMYHGDFSAVGLLVSDGNQTVPLNTAVGEGNFFLKPNGVFVLAERGAQVIEASEYPRLGGHVILATQSGPLLLRRGQIHRAFRADSTSRLYRNGVGVRSPETALFVITENPVNFHEFAAFFLDGLRCHDALFLDGTISSLHAPKLKRSDFRMDLGPIIGVVEK